MTWVKLDDQFAFHPKAASAGPEAMWLYVAGLCWCSQHLTDGRIPKATVPILAAVKRTTAAKLVEVGLWDDHGDAYEVHDYLEFQPSKAKVEADREAARKRQENFRRGHGARNGVTPPVTDDRSSASPTPDPTPTDVDTSSDDDQPLAAADGSSSGGSHRQVIARAGEIAAELRVPPPRDPSGFATKVATNIAREQSWAIAQLLELRPDLGENPERLAHILATDGAPKAIEEAKRWADVDATLDGLVPAAEIPCVVDSAGTVTDRDNSEAVLTDKEGRE